MDDLHEMVTGHVKEILDSINAGVYLTDMDRRIVFWNREAERITGYSADEVVGSQCREGILEHQDGNGRALCTRQLCPLHRSIVTDKPSESPVLVFAKTRSGERKPLSTTTAPLHNGDGKVVGGIEVFHDESENLKKLSLARAAQRHLLRDDLPGDGRISFAVEYAPMEMIGGDYYYFEHLPGERYAAFLADVAGHGVSAALYTSLLHSLARECRDRLDRPAEFLFSLNERLCDRIPEVDFITALEAVFDPAEGRITWCSAGHTPPFVYRAGEDRIEVIETHQYPLGLPENDGYDSTEIEVSPGDQFLLYTDGAIELPVGEDRLLGTEGFAAMFRDVRPAGRAHRLGDLYETLVDRCYSHMPEDDITLVSALIL
jgi:PAS domain S-box-containing protein